MEKQQNFRDKLLTLLFDDKIYCIQNVNSDESFEYLKIILKFITLYLIRLKLDSHKNHLDGGFGKILEIPKKGSFSPTQSH